MGSLRTDPQTAGDRKARRYLSDVGNHQPRTPPFSPSRQTNLFRGGRGFSISDATPPQTTSPGCRDGPSTTPRIQEDEAVHCQSTTPPRVPSAKVLTGLESRREGMKSPQASRAKRAPSEDKRRPGATGPQEARTHVGRQKVTTGHLFSLLCCRTFGMSHTYGRRHLDHQPGPDIVDDNLLPARIELPDFHREFRSSETEKARNLRAWTDCRRHL